MEIIVRGNLELRVATYAKLKSPVEDFELDEVNYPAAIGDLLFVMYSGDCPVEFFEHINAPSEYVKLILANLAQDDVKKDSVQVYATFVPQSCEAGIRDGLHDLVYTGEQESAVECTASVESALAVYLFFYSSLHKKEVQPAFEDVRDFDLEQSGDYEFDPDDLLDVEEEEVVTHYSSVSNNNLRDYMVETYCVPVIRAQREGNSKLLMLAKDLFCDFVEGAPFEKDISDMLSQFEVGKEPNRPLVLTYLEKAYAIYDEDYERAAKLRDIIEDLKN